MKITITILSVYMLALALVPCGDNAGNSLSMEGLVPEQEQGAYAEHDHHTDGCEDDSCSPLCACSCCSIPLSSAKAINRKQNVLFPVQQAKPTFAPAFNPSAFQSLVWHPPAFS